MSTRYDLPREFIDSIRSSVSGDADALLASLDTESPVSIRFNPYKLGEKPDGDPVPWNRYGFYLSERPQFTLDPLFHAGIYYVQEASSMFIEALVRFWAGEGPDIQTTPHHQQSDSEAVTTYTDTENHDGDKGTPSTSPTPAECQNNTCTSAAGLRSAQDATASGPRLSGLRILDLCAAPGGKTTLLSSLAGMEGLVVANEPVKQRAGILADNVRKWGLGNVLVTCNDPGHFDGFRDYFDIVLVDAPCSGEGMFRKSDEARREWSPANVNTCTARQKDIISDAWELLRPGGLLIYSTCTFNSLEDEGNVAWIRSNFDCEGLNYTPPASWGISTGKTEGVAHYHFYPHRLRGEGFFAAAVVKEGGKAKPRSGKPRRSVFSDVSKSEAAELSRWVNQPEYMTFRKVGDNIYGYYSELFRSIKELSENLNVIYSGVCMGQLFGGKLRPDHALAMFHDLDPEAAPAADLDLLQALNYLRRGDTDSDLLEADGFNLICYNGIPLGWAKRIGNRVNNLYPKELRIQNL